MYVGIYACVYVCMCMFIYVCICFVPLVLEGAKLPLPLCKVTVWHLLAPGGGGNFIMYVCV